MKNTFFKKHSLLLIFSIICSISLTNAQQKEIQGKVTDSGGIEMPGVNVSIKGGTSGVITDLSGKYRIRAAASDILVFSFIGFQTEERRVADNKVIDVTISENVKALDEVVVIGYGEAKKRDLTGSVSSIQSKDLERIPVNNAAEAITGKLAGVQVVTTDGTPGADIKIRVRGGNSITQDNSPLYIIDGFPSDLGLEGIDPKDIQSIDILKDASSTSIYGSRGSNGVIIVTTKSGHEGFSINYNAHAGFKKITKTLPVQNSLQFVKSQWERRLRLSGLTTDMSSLIGLYGDWSDYDALYGDSPYVDWQNQIFGRTAMVQSHNFVINGGSKSTKYNASFTYDNEDGIMINSGLKQYFYKLRLDQKLNSQMDLTASANYKEAKVYGAGTAEGQDTYSSLVNVLQYRPVAGLNATSEDLLNEDADASSDDSYDYNPITMAKNIDKTKDQKSLQLNAGLNYKITKYLTLRLSGGISNVYSNTATLYNQYSYYAIKAGGISATIDNREDHKWNTSNILTYRKRDKNNDLTVMLGQEANKRDYKRQIMYANKFPNADIVIDNMGQAETHYVESDAFSETLLSFFGRANYSYLSRYLFSASLRSDGSSKFAKDKRFGYFPAASVAWRMSEENFFKPLENTISNLKLRYSFGASGNNRIDNYLYSTSYTPVYYGLNNTQTLGVGPSALANPDLTWETTYTNNLGIDLNLFKNKLSITAEAYLNRTVNLLLDADINPVSGYSSQMLNIGKTQNKGLEFTVNANIIRNKTFTWDAGFNISFNQNKILALNHGSSWSQDYFIATSSWGYMSGDYIVKVGQPLGLMYGFVSDGIYTANDFKDEAFTTGQFTPANLKDDVPYAETQAKEQNLLGQMKVKRFSDAVDANDHPIASADKDKVVIGDANPKHFGGFNTSFTYKGFDCSIFLNWVYGNDIYNATKLRGDAQMYNNKNVLYFGQRYTIVDPATGEKVLDRDKLNELNANATMWAIPEKAETLTSWAIEDGSFLRINNVSFGYTLPYKLLKNLYINSLRLYVTGYNLYTFTKYTGYDPEVDSRYSSAITPGLDYAAYPKSRQFIFGANITF